MRSIDLSVLAEVRDSGGEAWGNSIVDKLHLRLPSVHAALDRLEERGLIEGELMAGSGTLERGGKRKRVYRITGEGLAALRSP